ncbi:MAG TPA: DinB family protein [Acidothermaceae bacterium]|nr:DinB family protein [Acidothermaceae bacterium]
MGIADVERVDPPLIADERATLIGFLEYHRQTLLAKCADLTDEQLRRRAVPPSSLSLLGLVRHLSEVERGWFQRGVLGDDAPPLYWTESNRDGDFDDVDNANVGDAFDEFARECARSREILATRTLDDTFVRRGETISIRWLLAHLIEEYARHNGHADLLREVIDGVTGE